MIPRPDPKRGETKEHALDISIPVVDACNLATFVSGRVCFPFLLMVLFFRVLQGMERGV
jgi:hypothetical protein